MNQETEIEMLMAYERYLKLKGIKVTQMLIRQLMAFFKWARDEGRDINYLPDGIGEQYSAYLLARNLKRATVNGKLSTLRCFGHWLVKTDRVASSPFWDLKLLRLGRTLPKHILHTDDLSVLLSRFRMRTPYDVLAKTLMELQYGSGLRISEALLITKDALNITDRSLLIYEPKTNQQRVVPVTDAFLQSLDFYFAQAYQHLVAEAQQKEGFIFPQFTSTSVRHHLNDILKRETARLGLATITSHSFRHMAATHLLKKGAGIRQVQAFLGHQNIASTEVYTHVYADDIKKTLNTFHPLEVGHVTVD